MKKSTAGQRRFGWVFKLLLALVSAGLTLVLMDVALRVTGIGAPRRGVIAPKPARHLLTEWIEVFPPGYTGTLTARDFKVGLRVNSLGLRERELDVASLSAQHPCVFLGDSYFFGWGVEPEQRLSERLGASLSGEARPVPTVNLSFPGWATIHYLSLWDRYVRPLKPSLVVASCFIGNDFADDLKQAFRLKSGASAPAQEAPTGDRPEVGMGARARELLSTSPLVGFLQHLLWKSPGFRQAFNRVEMRNDRIALFEAESSDLQRRLYGGTESAYTELARVAKEAGIPVLVVLIPDHLQILNPELFQGVDLERPQKEMKAHLDRLGLASVDLLPVFRAADHPERFFFREDKHWNAAGHAFVAEALLPAVRERLRAGSAGSTP